MSSTTLTTSLRNQLVDRQSRLQGLVGEVGEADDLVRLLHEVDTALRRLDGNTYGMCEVCGEEVEEDFLAANPLTQYCLCHLDDAKLSALTQDLGLAWRIQSGLLPKPDFSFAGWRAHYRYQPAGPVSGDYCDLVAQPGSEDALFFLLGDVSGKGVAASFLMAHLNALFRSLIDSGRPVETIVERANRIFSESTLSTHYATLVAGRAGADGEIEITNAGHCPPVVIRAHGKVETVASTGVPVGMFEDSAYATHRVSLSRGDSLFLYSDGLSEAVNGSGQEYGDEGVERFLRRTQDLRPARLVDAAIKDLDAFVDGGARRDDLTIMVVRREG